MINASVILHISLDGNLVTRKIIQLVTLTDFTFESKALTRLDLGTFKNENFE